MMIQKKCIGTVVAILLPLCGVKGCASKEPPPLELIGAAKMAVHDAERDDYTPQLAAVEFQSARGKLALANSALQKRDNVAARRMSEQAIVDAQLAKAKAQTAKSTIGTNEVRDALHDVQREINRNQ